MSVVSLILEFLSIVSNFLVICRLLVNPIQTLLRNTLPSLRIIIIHHSGGSVPLEPLENNGTKRAGKLDARAVYMKWKTLFRPSGCIFSNEQSRELNGFHTEEGLCPKRL